MKIHRHLAVALALLASACGSYHSDAELAAAAGAGDGIAVNGAGSSTGSGGGSTAAGSAVGGGTSVDGGAAAAGGGQATGGGAAGGAGPATTTGGGGGGVVANGAPIRIGEVGLYSGIGGAVFTSQSQAVRAWVDDVNRRGGVNGHPVELSVIDDGGDPARHRAGVQQLIDQGVVAFVGNAETLTGRGSIDLLEQHRVPVIGSETGSPHYYESPMYFLEGSNGNSKFFADLAAIARYMNDNGLQRLATATCTEAQSCADADRIYSSRAAEFGISVVSRSRVSIAQPDFTGECLGARNADAQAFLLVLDGPSVSRLAQSCSRVGVSVPIGLSTSSPGIVDDPNVPVAVFASTVFPWVLADTPAQQEFHEVFGRFPDARFDSQSAGGWAAAKIFELAVSRAIAPDAVPSSELVLEGLWTIQNETLGGLVAPITYVRDQPPVEYTCYFLMQTVGDEWQASNGGQAECPQF